MSITSIALLAFENREQIEAIVNKVLFVGRALVETNMARNEINDRIATAIESGETVEDKIANLDALYAEAKAFADAQWEEAKSINPLLQ